MSRITKITTVNTKGHDLETELSGRDIFIGPNGTGKSTHLESFMIGVLGKIPGKRESLGDIFDMSSGETMSISLESESGFICKRDIVEKKTRHNDGGKSFSKSMKLAVSPSKTERTDKDRKARIVEEFGDFAIMFNLDMLFNVSDNERRKFVFSLVDPSQFGWDKKRVMGALARTTPDALMTEIEENWNDDVSLQDNVTNSLLFIKEKTKDVRAAHKKAMAAKEQLLKQKREIGSNPGSSGEIEDELKKARSDEKKLRQDLATGKERGRLILSLTTRESTLRTTIPELLKVDKASIKALEVELASLGTEAEKLRSDVKKLNALEDAATDKIESLLCDLSEKNKRSMLKEQIASALDIDGKCPISGIDCTTDFSQYVKEKQAALAKMESEVATLVSKVKATKENRDSAATDTETVIELGKALVETIGVKQKELNNLKSNEAVAAERAENIAKQEKELHGLQEELQKLTPIDITPLEATVNGIEVSIEKLEEQLANRQEVQNLLKSFDTANIEAMELDKELDELLNLQAAIGPQNLQGKILKDTLGPVIDKTNELLSKTGRDYNLSAILEDKNGKEVFDFSWKHGDQEIPFHALSGGETVVFSAALVCALVLQKNPKLKALAIEASETDIVNLTALMESISQFGTELDNVLIATHAVDVKSPPQVDGWEVHDLSAAASTAV